MYEYTYVCNYVCMNVRMYESIYVYMYVCKYVRMYVCSQRGYIFTVWQMAYLSIGLRDTLRLYRNIYWC